MVTSASGKRALISRSISWASMAMGTDLAGAADGGIAPPTHTGARPRYPATRATGTTAWGIRVTPMNAGTATPAYPRQGTKRETSTDRAEAQRSAAGIQLGFMLVMIQAPPN